MFTQVTYKDVMDIPTLMRLAYLEAHQNSEDPSTQNGAILLAADGIMLTDVNRMPHKSMATKENFQRPRKYKLIGHAEQPACISRPLVPH